MDIEKLRKKIEGLTEEQKKKLGEIAADGIELSEEELAKVGGGATYREPNVGDGYDFFREDGWSEEDILGQKLYEKAYAYCCKYYYGNCDKLWEIYYDLCSKYGLTTGNKQ